MKQLSEPYETAPFQELPAARRIACYGLISALLEEQRFRSFGFSSSCLDVTYQLCVKLELMGDDAPAIAVAGAAGVSQVSVTCRP